MNENGRNDDPYRAQSEVARAIRENVADQLHDLVVERNDLGALDEIAKRVRQVGEVHQQMIQARGRQAQAAEHGLPVAKAVRDEKEARGLLRASILSLGEACGSAVVGMDVEDARPRLESRA